jgi:HTH-type transcriptional regulator, sugar sensing transcriptional regulator
MLAVLKKLGLSDKEIAVYAALLALGSASVRQIAVAAKVNRGTTYDILKSLATDGLVSYINKDKKHYFAAEDPAQLQSLVVKRQKQLTVVGEELQKEIPQLQTLHKRGGDKPVVRYFEGKRGIHALLSDVLATMGRSKEKMYYVYSSAALREQYRAAYPTFTKERIAKKIRVRAIAMGSGGETSGLDERKWVTDQDASPTYTLIYGGHMAHMAHDAAGQMVGVIIENEAMYKTHKMLFETLWKHL